MNAETNVGSAVSDLNAVSGWRLLLYAFLGTWVIGKTGTAVAEIIHGPTDYGAMIAKIVQPDETTKPASTSTTPKVAGIDVGSIASIPEIDSLAANLAATFGPLPPEAIPGEGGTINVGSAKAIPWLAGIIAAAVGVAWYVRHRGAVAPLAVKTSPVEVKPVDLNVKPQLPSIPGLNAPASPGAPETQQVQQVADLIKTVMQQGQQIAQPKV